MNKLVTIFTIAVLFVAGCKTKEQPESLTQYVDPTIGNVGILLQPTRPTAQLPNQSIRMHPVRADYMDDQISFFPLTMASHRNGELFGVLPGVGNPENGTWKSRQTYDHQLEVTRPFFFSTYLIDEEITTDFAPAAKSGFFRFTFPENGEKRLRFNLKNVGEWKVLSEKTITGTEEFEGMKAFVFGEFDVEPKVLIEDNGTPEQPVGKPVGWFDFSGSKNPVVQFKYAISFINAEQAEKNLRNEIADWDFEEIADKGKATWETALGKIQVKGGTEAQKRSFYTALYRTYERMINITEDGKYYSAYDHQVHESERDFYVDDWVWDTYLVHHPLRMIIDTKKENDMLWSYVKMYEQSGWMPQFPLLFMDNPAMHGFHSTIVFLDAYRKNLRDYDIQKAYEGIKKNATDATMLPWRNGPKTPLDVFYREKGFFPALAPGETETYPEVHGFEKRQSVAITLAHSYDDWALGQMAKELGKEEDYKYFNAQAANYRNLYRPETKLMWPKNEKGEWLDIDPKFDGGMGGRDYYDENNAYTYQWHVQHDIQGLIELMGGREEFSKTLDQLFREPLGRSKYAFTPNSPMPPETWASFRWAMNPAFIFRIYSIIQANPGKHKNASDFCSMFGLRIIFSEFPAMRMAAG
jgi:predicted alpha-1,2-mannosidase